MLDLSGQMASVLRIMCMWSIRSGSPVRSNGPLMGLSQNDRSSLAKEEMELLAMSELWNCCHPMGHAEALVNSLRRFTQLTSNVTTLLRCMFDRIPDILKCALSSVLQCKQVQTPSVAMLYIPDQQRVAETCTSRSTKHESSAVTLSENNRTRYTRTSSNNTRSTHLPRQTVFANNLVSKPSLANCTTPLVHCSV